MNKELQEHINQSLKQGLRLDKRKADQWRDLTVDVDCVATAEGSARVKAGNCELIAGVKLSIGTPFPDRPDEGVLMVGAELRPMSNPNFEAGPPSIESIETARVIDRTIRESKTIDVKKLVIESGAKVWIVQVDIVPINADGNLIDLGALAALIALKHTKFPEVKDGLVDYKKRSTKALVLQEEPLSVTVFKMGETLIVDPTQTEQEVAQARLTFGMKPNGNICSMQKGGDATLTPEVVMEMVKLAQAKNKELRKVVK